MAAKGRGPLPLNPEGFCTVGGVVPEDYAQRFCPRLSSPRSHPPRRKPGRTQVSTGPLVKFSRRMTRGPVRCQPSGDFSLSHFQLRSPASTHCPAGRVSGNPVDHAFPGATAAIGYNRFRSADCRPSLASAMRYAAIPRRGLKFSGLTHPIATEHTCLLV